MATEKPSAPIAAPLRAVGRFLRPLVRPSTVGAAWLLALSGLGLLRTLTDDSVQGVSAPSVRRLIKTQFAREVIQASGMALATAMVIGLALGLCVQELLRVRDWLSGRAHRSAYQLAWPALGVIAIAHGMIWLRDLATYPQAYAPALYAHGGMRAALQIVACDWLGPRGVVALGVMLWAAWFAPAFRQAWQGRRSVAIAVAASLPLAPIALSLLAAAFDRATTRHVQPASPERPNVLILAADSLRADRLDPRVAPNLTALAEHGARFDRAYVSLPRTFPSWVSTLSGRDPHHHGIRHMFPRWEARRRDVGAIPGSFSAAGFHTAVVSDFAGDIFRRMDLGFAQTRTPTFNIRELVRETVAGGQGPLLPFLRTRFASSVLPVLRELHDTTDPDVVTADALDQIDRAAGRPFFVVAFYSTTHFPYAAPAPFATRYVDPAYRGPYRYGKTPAIFAEHEPSPADVQAIRGLYDGAVAAVDRSAAALLEGLRRRGLDKSTIVVVTADHGESLYEPGRGQGHGDHLFGDEVSHVPLVIVDPRRSAPVRSKDLVRSVDLAPTLCELASVRCADGMDGRSLVPLMEGKALPAKPVFAETGLWFTRQIPDVPPELRMPCPELTEALEVDIEHDGDVVTRDSFEPWLIASRHRMVRDERYKLVYAPTRQGARWMLFDTQLDPEETRDRSAEHPEIVARLQALLWPWMLEDSQMARRGDLLVTRPHRSDKPASPQADATRRAPGVAIRLAERVGSAVVDAPNLASVDAGLDHWRRMRSPWIHAAGDAERAVQQIAFVRSGGTHKLKPTGNGRTWDPDPRLWNMNDGSFDQREAILAPPPASLRFPGTVLPAGAKLESAIAVVGPNVGGVEFEVAVKSEGVRSVAGKRALEQGAHGTYEDWQVDLSAWGGKTVELELVTRGPPTLIHPAAIWGAPVVIAPAASDFPFNVLYIVVDALRGDAVASTHDADTDARMAAAKYPPLDAFLPKLPEVAPNLDALAAKGVIFSQAYSAATWTRPSTVAMMAGIPSGDLGLSATPLVPTVADLQHLYARRPPFLPLLLRPHGMWTRAVVNNYYMVGYAGVGVDMGFDSLVDHRYGTEDTAEILKDATRELEQAARRRFFLFVNFVSPHGPYEPPPSALEAIPKPPRAPQHEVVRQYLAEIHKDDAAIGALVARVRDLGLADDTLIVVTADHGETLSRSHTAIPFGVAAEPDTSGRFQHLLTLYDETAHVPLLLVLPGKLPAGMQIRDPVSNTDVVATLFELAGMQKPANVRGESLLALVRGARAPDRPVFVEGRGGHSLRVGPWRLIVRDPGHTRVRIHGVFVEQPVELYDLETDPGERVEVSQQHPDVVERLLALDRARQSSSAAAQASGADAHPALRLRFAGAGARHRVSGRIVARKAGSEARLTAAVVALKPEAIRQSRDSVELDFETLPDAAVGVDLQVEPSDADVSWELRLDGGPWPAERVYAGALGIAMRELSAGVVGDGGRAAVSAEGMPWIDFGSEIGLFVARDASGQALEGGGSDDAKREAMGLMRAWGYVR